MKIFKIFFLILPIVVCFNASNVLAANTQFPDVLRLQPIPSGVHPSTLNKNEISSGNNGSLLQQISQGGLDESQLDPNTSYVDTTDHLLFVSDPADNCVLVFDLTPDNVLIDNIPDNILGQPDFTSSAPGTTQSSLNGPTGLAYDPNNNELFVADTNNNRIMIFNISSVTNGENAVNVLGQPDFTSSAPGTTQSSLDSPYSLVFDPVNGILFVTDVNNNRVVTFNISSVTNGENAVNVLGQPDFTSSAPGITQSSLDSPKGLAYDPGSKKIFVADTNNNRIMVFGGIPSISNGENAVNIISPSENSMMNPYIADRMQDKPNGNIGFPKSKPASSIYIWVWLAVVTIIAVFIIIVITRAMKMQKRMEKKY